MTSVARAWLPDSAFGLDAVRSALGGAIKTWSERWFSNEAAVLKACGRSFAADREMLRHEQHCGAIAMSPLSKRALLEAALVTDLAQIDLNDDDRATLDMFAEEIGRDLLREIGMETTDEAMSKHFAIPLVISGSPILTLHLPEDRLAGQLQRMWTQTTAGKGQLVRRSRALGKTSVLLEAILGHGLLSLRELDDIAPGDVVLLERRAADGADLLLADHRSRLARGALGRSGDKPSLYL